MCQENRSARKNRDSSTVSVFLLQDKNGNKFVNYLVVKLKTWQLSPEILTKYVKNDKN